MTYALKPKSKPGARTALQPELSARAAVEDFRRRLLRWAVKLIWNRDDAEEIVQEAFAVALSKGVQLSEERFGPWMFRTVGNLCLNARRRRRPEPLDATAIPADNTTPEAAARKVEQLDRLRAAVGQLPDQQRLAVVLRMMEQMAYDDIAQIMGLSISAVRAHVHLGRRKLAETMGDSAREAW